MHSSMTDIADPELKALFHEEVDTIRALPEGQRLDHWVWWPNSPPIPFTSAEAQQRALDREYTMLPKEQRLEIMQSQIQWFERLAQIATLKARVWEYIRMASEIPRSSRGDVNRKIDELKSDIETLQEDQMPFSALSVSKRLGVSKSVPINVYNRAGLRKEDGEY